MFGISCPLIVWLVVYIRIHHWFWHSNLFSKPNNRYTFLINEFTILCSRNSCCLKNKIKKKKKKRNHPQITHLENWQTFYFVLNTRQSTNKVSINLKLLLWIWLKLLKLFFCRTSVIVSAYYLMQTQSPKHHSHKSCCCVHSLAPVH